jgi:hypothetical protein
LATNPLLSGNELDGRVDGKSFYTAANDSAVSVMEPTPFPDLNGVLSDLVVGARDALQDNFCGAYLQGSFALGDAGVWSDVDFIVVTNAEVDDGQVAALRELHRRLYALDVPWAQHLEGSYVPKDKLRRPEPLPPLDPRRTPFLYLDNGASELVWDSHCNTAVVRWSLREHGIVLAGPRPGEIVDPVSAEQLRAEAVAFVDRYAACAPEPTRSGGMSRWEQPYLVLTFCRALYTIEVGRVGSKKDARAWALNTLPSEWRSLIQASLDDRADPWERVHQPADAGRVGRTLAFANYAVSEARRTGG